MLDIQFVCAKLVNVTSACRRSSRGIFIDEPIILTFDEELEETIDEAFHRVLLHPQFVPTRTLGYDVFPIIKANCEYNRLRFYRLIIKIVLVWR